MLGNRFSPMTTTNATEKMVMASAFFQAILSHPMVAQEDIPKS
jgi:hypothetical protein